MSIARPLSLHELLDTQYGPDADEVLRTMLRHGDNPDARAGPRAEAPLHVATRRRRLSAVTILLDHGAAIDAETLGGKTAYTHAIRRGFTEIAEVLAARGADRRLNDADRLAVALTQGSLDEADAIYAAHRHVIRTGNPEE